MTRWRRICCAVDFQGPSWLAMEHAAALAKRFGAELTLVYVVAPPPRAWDGPAATRGISPRAVEEGERMMRRWASDASARTGRPVSGRVLAGEPAAELVSFAREAESDLVVVGARAPMGMTRMLQGSLAGRLSRKCSCPVLVVHDHARREEGRSEGTGPLQ